jgi:hypothetical protein
MSCIVTGNDDAIKVTKVDLKTGFENKSKSNARFSWNGGKLKVTPGTKIRLGGKKELLLLQGKIITTVNSLDDDETFNIRSPTAVAGVRGTQFSIEVGTGEDTLKVIEGKVEFGDDQEKKLFKEKQRSSRTAKGWDVKKMTDQEVQAELLLIGDILRRKSKNVMVLSEIIVGKGRANLIKGLEVDQLEGHALEAISGKLRKAKVQIRSAPSWVREGKDILLSSAQAYEKGEYGFSIQIKVVLTPGSYNDAFSLYEMNAQVTVVAVDGMTAEQMSISTKKGKGRGKSPVSASEQALDKAIASAIRPFSKLLIKTLTR